MMNPKYAWLTGLASHLDAPLRVLPFRDQALLRIKLDLQGHAVREVGRLRHTEVIFEAKVQYDKPSGEDGPEVKNLTPFTAQE